MNRITRLLAIAGMGLGAAIALAGPAQAATGDTSHRASVTAKAHWGDDGDDIVGYFSNPFSCNRAGHIGEIRGRWDDYDCYRARWGHHGGDWALSVSGDDNWGGGSWNHGWHHGPFGGGGGPFHGPFGGPFHGPFGGPFHGPIGFPFPGPGPIPGPGPGPIPGPGPGPIPGPGPGPIPGPGPR